MIARAFLNSGATSFLVLFFNISTGIIAARVLGPEDRGLLGVVIFWAHFLSALATLANTDALVVGLAKFKERRGIVEQAYKIAWSAIAVALLLGSIIIWTAVGPYGPVLLALALAFYFVQLIQLCLSQIAEGIIRSEGRFSTLNYLRFCVPGAYLVFLLAAVALGGGLSTFIAAHAAALIFTLVVQRGMTRSWRVKGSKTHVGREFLKTNAGFHGIALTGILAAQIDRLAVVQTSSPAAIGLYFVAATVVGPMLGFVQTAIVSIALPALLSVREAHRPAAAIRLLQMTWVLSLLGAVAMAAVAPNLVPILFGVDFAPAGLLASGLVLAGSLLPVRQAIIEILKSAGEPRPAMMGGGVFVVTFAAVFSLASVLSTTWPVVWALGVANAASVTYLSIALNARMPTITIRAWILPTAETARELLTLSIRSVRGTG